MVFNINRCIAFCLFFGFLFAISNADPHVLSQLELDPITLAPKMGKSKSWLGKHFGFLKRKSVPVHKPLYTEEESIPKPLNTQSQSGFQEKSVSEKYEPSILKQFENDEGQFVIPGDKSRFSRPSGDAKGRSYSPEQKRRLRQPQFPLSNNVREILSKSDFDLRDGITIKNDYP